jgi:hypothetical protein
VAEEAQEARARRHIAVQEAVAGLVLKAGVACFAGLAIAPQCLPSLPNNAAMRAVMIVMALCLAGFVVAGPPSRRYGINIRPPVPPPPADPLVTYRDGPKDR